MTQRIIVRFAPPHRALAAFALLLAVMIARARADNRWPDERQAGQFLCHADFPLAPQQPLLDELAQLQHDAVPPLSLVAWHRLALEQTECLELFAEVERQHEAVCQALLT